VSRRVWIALVVVAALWVCVGVYYGVRWMIDASNAEAAACAAKGGREEQTGVVPITTYIKSGSSTIPVTNYVPIYSCVTPR